MTTPAETKQPRLTDGWLEAGGGKMLARVDGEVRELDESLGFCETFDGERISGVFHGKDARLYILVEDTEGVQVVVSGSGTSSYIKHQDRDFLRYWLLEVFS